MDILYFLMSAIIIVVILLHLLFAVLEMFFWLHPKVRKIFAMSIEKASDSKQLAANVGLYNGFLAAGLIWGLSQELVNILIFFLSCITIAGVYAGLTAKRTLLWVQAAPAFIALVLVWLN